ncbi:hypothetical protein BH23CHL5_BH23CHL5_10190 [soil metagenome]
MTRYLLDANLSPKTAKHLSLALGLDVESLLTRGLGEISDAEVRRIAKSENRVIITLDRDFVQPYLASGTIDQGVLYLDLPSHLRFVSSVNAVLERFFVSRRLLSISNVPLSSSERTKCTSIPLSHEERFVFSSHDNWPNRMMLSTMQPPALRGAPSTPTTASTAPGPPSASPTAPSSGRSRPLEPNKRWALTAATHL